MAGRYIRVGGRTYGDGDLLVAPSGEPIYRGSSGLLANLEVLFLVYYDEKDDMMALEPLSWVVATRIFGNKLREELARVRPRGI